jgi:preprotein translocase subunit YajC
MNTLILALAQTTPAQPTGQPSSGPPFFFLAIMLAMVAFMLLSARSQKKREKRKRDDMHARLSKNDRVLTVGGVLGTVISVKEGEVVLKVDESTNTKMTFITTAIQRIVSDDADAPGLKS